MHVVLDEKTPEEVFTSEKSNISHLQVFGCLVYIHISKEKRPNLESFRKKGNFVGYNEASKAFKIYIPSERHVEVSRDVTFHEEASFKRLKEIEYDQEIEEVEDPVSKDHDDDCSPSDV